MAAYLLKRLLMIVPTLFGIMLINFVIIQFTPGGPIERYMARINGTEVSITDRINGGTSELAPGGGVPMRHEQ